MLRHQPPIELGLRRRADPAPRSTRHVPYAEWDKLTRGRRHPLVGAASALAHALVILLALSSTRTEQEQSKVSPESQPQVVPMVYIPPPEPPKPPAPKPVPPTPPPPTPAFADAPPRPTADLPSPGEKDVAEHDDPVASSPSHTESPARQERPVESAYAEDNDPMVTEARRLFGPSSAPSSNLAGPLRSGLPLPLMEGGSRCPDGQEVAQIDRPAEGVIEGVVRTESGGHPIPGAFLQIVGNGASTFADDAGHYRLVFDPALVDACRSQLVRVTAIGYRARTMVLSWGRPSANIIDLAGKP